MTATGLPPSAAVAPGTAFASVDDLAEAWALADAEACRLALVHPFDRDRPVAGETAARLAALGEVDAHAAALLGRGRVLRWLRLPNGELFGLPPLAWMAAPGRRLEQLAMRLRAERGMRGAA